MAIQNKKAQDKVKTNVSTTAKTMPKKMKRRSDIKLMTKEASVLKYLRESRKLSIRKAATIIGLSDTKLNHAENGRCDLNPEIILKILMGYGYSYEHFMKMVEDKIPLPANCYAECIEILKRLDKEKLKTVKAILESF